MRVDQNTALCGPLIVFVSFIASSSDGSTDVYIIDIINAVCPGGNQTTSWTDQTEVTHEEGAVGRWIYPRPQ